MTWKSYALSGAGLIATYFASGTARPFEKPPASNRIQTAQAKSATDIQDLAVRLQERVRTETAFRQPARNPFRFSARPSASPSVSSEVRVAVPPPTAAFTPAAPPLTLIGIAADDVDGGMPRTAIISTNGNVLLVKVGDGVGTYTVSKVEEAAVELTTADGSMRRLTFKP